MFGEHSFEGSQAFWCFDVADSADDDHWWCFDNRNGFDCFFLVQSLLPKKATIRSVEKHVRAYVAKAYLSQVCPHHVQCVSYRLCSRWMLSNVLASMHHPLERPLLCLGVSLISFSAKIPKNHGVDVQIFCDSLKLRKYFFESCRLFGDWKRFLYKPFLIRSRVIFFNN